MANATATATAKTDAQTAFDYASGKVASETTIVAAKKAENEKLSNEYTASFANMEALMKKNSAANFVVVTA